MTRPSASELAEMLAARVDDLVPTLLPSARRCGGYWSVGSVDGEPGNSLYIHRSGTKVGKWTDTATGEFGDLLDLVNQTVGGGRDLIQAIKWASAWLGIDPDDPSSIERGPRHIPPAQSAEDEAAISAAFSIWQKCQAANGTLAQIYTCHRGITVDPLPPSLRFNGAMVHFPTGLALPALVAAISGSDHKVTAIQRTYLREDGRGKAGVAEPKMTLGRMLNGAVRLAPASDQLGLAEGVETALSAMQLHGVPVWAACGSRMDAIAVPDSVTRLVIFADNGQPGVGAAERAALSHDKPGRTIEVLCPAGDVKDWNDTLRAEERAA